MSQLRSRSIILHLCKRTIFARLRYFTVSGIVKVSGEHCLQVVWSKVVEGLNTLSFFELAHYFCVSLNTSELFTLP